MKGFSFFSFGRLVFNPPGHGSVGALAQVDTGITGQDGSYLAEFLLKKGYQVFGLVRRSSTENFSRIRDVQDELSLLPAICWTRTR